MERHDTEQRVEEGLIEMTEKSEQRRSWAREKAGEGRAEVRLLRGRTQTGLPGQHCW